MYTEFFGLQHAPFNNTLDTSAFFESPQHGEALASLVYSVREHKGLVVVTGDVGTGKTIVGRMLAASLGSATDIVSPNVLDGGELLPELCRELQLPVDATFSIMELVGAVEEFLLTQHSKKRTTLLLIDDAQVLPDSHFDQLRLLSNLEVSGGKLLQIVLLGQPELQQRLSKPVCRQLKQRIFRSFHIEPLNAELTERYIKYRVAAAGSKDENLFEDEAVGLIHRYAGGVPRLVNNLCDNLLLSAFSDQVKQIEAPRVHAVIDELATTESTARERLAEGTPDEVDQAIAEIANQYVESLETQLAELHGTTAETDRRISEMHRLSAKLQAQEQRIGEHQRSFDAKMRQLHELSVTLQDRQRALADREGAVDDKLKAIETLVVRVDGLDQRVAEREARMAQQHDNLDSMSKVLIEQDQKLTERAHFIDSKLTNRQVAFDRELNECKRAINRKWQDMKQLVVENASRDTEWSKRLAAVDMRLKRFESIEPDLSRAETRLIETATRVQGELTTRTSETANSLRDQEKQLRTLSSEVETALGEGRRDLERHIARRHEIDSALERHATNAEGHLEKIERTSRQTIEQLEQIVNSAQTIMARPQELMTEAERQLAQVERMAALVQKASGALQKTLDNSVVDSKKLREEASTVRRELQDVTSEADEVLDELVGQVKKTHRLRDVLKEIFEKSDAQLDNLRSHIDRAERHIAVLPKKYEELQASAAHPTQLVHELRSVGSAAERNIQEGSVKLTELRSMIDKAERARRSIEALVTATRRVAENRRRPAPANAPTDAVGDQIATLRGAVQRLNGGENQGEAQDIQLNV